MGHSSAAGLAPDLYRTLQVDPGAHPCVIKAAYRALIRMAHPDVGGDVGVAQSLTSAYQILGDLENRHRYDLKRVRKPRPKPGSAVPDIAGSLKARLAPALEPLARITLARGFDLAGRLRGGGDHRIWLKALRDPDPGRKAAFRALAGAGRFTRSVWEWGSDLFVAVVPRWRPHLVDLLHGPLGPWPSLGSAIIVLDSRTGLIHYRGRANELPSYAIVAKAFRDVSLAARQPAA